MRVQEERKLEYDDMASSEFVTKLGVQNSRAVPHEVHVEPWANDYTLMPGEECEIIAIGKDSLPWFYVVEWEGASQVYCEETTEFKVLQKGY